MKQKIVIVFGTRPEAIKLAPIIKQFQQHSKQFHVKIIITAQHRDMVIPILDFFQIIPDYDLDIMRDSQNPSDVTAIVLQKIEKIYKKESPDWVMVQGDTSSALAAALAAFYQKIGVAHVEAGLRTGDLYSPYPEEMNRRLISQITSLHFAATTSNQENLLRENHDPQSIYVTGNPVIDALKLIVRQFNREDPLPAALTRIDPDKKLILLTTHRRENFGEPQKNIFEAINQLVIARPDIQVVFPVHPNPDVTRAVKQHLKTHPRLLLTPPLDYITFVRLMHLSYLILTDSGGIQEEAPALGKPVFVLRTTTERQELLTSGNGLLVDLETENIINSVNRILNNREEYRKMAEQASPFGDGHSASKIIEILETGYVRI